MNELAPGTLLGHYKIVRRLGQGGMGIVYEAVDQKLGRHVAIKLLPEATRESGSALERFWREARAASSLNHPGICTIHELNESAESPFIVMELLEGNSLEKLYRGQAMPYPKLVEMGTQLADALDAAHRKGVLHRDIKPANIFLTNSGQAKLLDFGLAKLESAADDDKITQDGNAPTAVNSLTSSGSSVGTVAYMSPEQARGEALDARSDVFSLGVVLYEMATGQHPFSGTTTAVVFDHILNHAPVAPISLNAHLPVEFENILNKTLEKDRDLRCQSAAELRADLKRLQRKSSSGSVGSSAVPSGSGSTPTQVPGSGTSNPSQPMAAASSAGVQAAPSGAYAAPVAKSRVWIVGVAGVLVLATGIAAWHFWPRTRPFSSVTVAQITNIGTIENVALSADGKFLAEVKNDNGQRTLWVRNVATNTDTQILGAFANDYLGLTFSPDANYLYFVRGTPDNTAVRALYAMPVFGGTPKQLAYDIDSGVSFSPDGSRLTYVKWTPYRKDQYSELHVADKDGGNNQIIYTTKDVVGPPVWSPDGGRIAWVSQLTGTNRTALFTIDVAAKKVDSVAPPADVFLTANERSLSDLAWLPDAKHLLVTYVRPHTDRTQIGTLAIPSGEFHSVTNDVNSYSQLALSGDGRTLATVLFSVDSSIAVFKGDGGATVSTTPLRITPASVRWADEKHMVYIIPSIGIGSIDLANGKTQSFDVGDMQIGGWIGTCPDGHIVFTGLPKGEGQARLFRTNAEGGDLTQVTSAGVVRAPFCSPDSQQVYFTLRGLPGSSAAESAVNVVPLAGGAPKQVIPPDTYPAASISRDAKLAAILHIDRLNYAMRIYDLATGRTLYTLPVEVSDFTGAGRIAPDNRSIVHSVLRNGGHTLLYQPFDGSPSHTMIDPSQANIFDIDWSPSGNQMGLLRVKSSSDVVLITDQQGKGGN